MKKAPPALSDEQIAADAMNEQGYLFQHKIATVLLTPGKKDKTKHRWELEATEVPVSLSDGNETRIDLVLRLGPQSESPVRAVIECKRAARDFKRWIFFAQNEIPHTPSPKSYYVERAYLRTGWDHRKEPDIVYSVDSKPAAQECPVFDYYVEAKLNRSNYEKRVSATDAIEDAFQQITIGQAGLGIRLRRAHVLNYRVLPVVVTTAELKSGHFDADDISLDRGLIESQKLKLRPRKWLAMNFRISEVISLSIPTGLHNRIPLAADLAMRQVRTVFVVQAEHVHEFLAWLERLFPTATNQ